jgi:hypothetical protein
VVLFRCRMASNALIQDSTLIAYAESLLASYAELIRRMVAGPSSHCYTGLGALACRSSR